MKKLLFCFTMFIAIALSCKHIEAEKNLTTDDKATTEISFYSADSIRVYGDIYEIDKSAPILLIYHQGGSNTRAEYKSIIPVLQKEGFNILTIDQRVGGQYFYGGYNRTVAEISKNEFHYCDAYPDMEAALKFVLDKGFTGKKIIWGSSYSATLGLKLAQENNNVIAGVLAFSPASGPPMKDCQPDTYIETLELPLLIMKPASEMESDRSKNQMELAKANNHQFYIAPNGVHGSSMLDESRIDGSANATWNVVKKFLSQFK